MTETIAADRFGRDTAVVTLGTLVSRLSGFGRVLATAAVLGSGALGDVYQAANLVPNLVLELVAGGVLQAVLLPSFVAARRLDGDGGLREAIRSTMGAVLVALGVVAAALMLLSPLLARLLLAFESSSPFRADKLDVMVPMLLIFIPQLVFYGMSMVVGAALNARGQFAAAAIAPAVNNVIVIAACLLFRVMRDGQEASLDLTSAEFAVIAGGTTLGVIAMVAVPAIVLHLNVGTWMPRWNLGHPAVVALRQRFGWATLTVVGTFVPTMVAVVLGSGAAGGVALFVYGFAFFALPHSLIAVPISTTLAPRVAARWQRDERTEIGDELRNAFLVGVPLLLLASAGLAALAWPTARVAAFGQTASQGIAPIAYAFMAFGLGLVGYGVAFVMMRVLLAIEDVRACANLVMVGAVAGVAVMGVLAAALPDDRRAAGLAIGYGVAQSVSAVLLIRRVRQLIAQRRSAGDVRWYVAAGISAVGSCTLMTIVQGSFGASRRESLVAVLVAGTAGVAAFALLLVVLMGGANRNRLQVLLRSRRMGTAGDAA